MNNQNTQHSLSWINPKLQLSESGIDGIGYTTKTSIVKGEILIVQSGQCVDVHEIDSNDKEPFWYYGFQIETTIYLYPHIRNREPVLDGIFRINHSCEPTAGFRGQVTLVAMRDLLPDEEITYDYAMTDIETDEEAAWTAQECHCGRPLCRKKITGNDWKLPDLQERYQGYFSTHVSQSIKSMSQ